MVEKISRECEDINITPMYWVNSANMSSIKLAQKAGFEIVSEEIVISII